MRCVLRETDRIIDISENAARLSVRYEQLVIESGDREASLPLNECAVLVVSHPRVLYTHSALTGICMAGGSVVLCNEKHLPAALLLPVDTHYAQAERFSRQAQANLPLKKRLWSDIVKAKVTAQGKALARNIGKDYGLNVLADTVRSGDHENVEAKAAQRYWKNFLGADFRRVIHNEDLNRHLNYGYAVLRAAIARAVCAVGLHPSLGLHHHNRYDAFCLADDLMEPLRPIIDDAVFSIASTRGHDAPLDREAKGTLIRALTDARLFVDGESRDFFDALTIYTSSLAAAFMGNGKRLKIPERLDG